MAVQKKDKLYNKMLGRDGCCKKNNASKHPHGFCVIDDDLQTLLVGYFLSGLHTLCPDALCVAFVTMS